MWLCYKYTTDDHKKLTWYGSLYIGHDRYKQNTSTDISFDFSYFLH